MVPADSRRIPRAPRYSGYRYGGTGLRVSGFHTLRRTFPGTSAHQSRSDVTVLQPPPRRNAPGLGSSPFARHYWGNHSYFLFLRVLRCFSSPRWPPSSDGWRVFNAPGFPIRTSADQGPFAPPRGFSQLITSFVASESLGIRRAPFVTFSSPWTAPSRRPGEYTFSDFVLYSFRFSYLSNMSKIVFFVENNGFEPLTPCLQSRCSSQLS